jgi:glycosyltransferase involved in cell wall biosynthesis
VSPLKLSVVVPSVNGIADLADCLDALAAQRGDCELEVLVVDRCGDAVRNEVRRRFPWVRLVEAERGTTIPELRARAFADARGDFVAVIEDHVIVPAGWARQLLGAAREAEQVVGGSVENAATERVVDWAAFLCEYSHCILPLPAGEAEWLTGNNVIYPRALLARYTELLAAGRWENHLHDALRRDGVRLECRPEIRVGHKKHYTVGEYLSQRYLYARSYAGARVAGAPIARRVAYGAAALALPPVLFYRTVSRVLSKRRHRAELVRSLPLLALFVTSWAFGEAVGYWAGPGDSLAKVC